MSSEFQELQEMISQDMNDKYSRVTLDHATNPRNVGEMQFPDGYGNAIGVCGDDMEIWLRVRDKRILNATFLSNGCGTTVACGSMITELAKGRSVIDARRISKEDVLEALMGLPEDHQHCAALATNALTNAVDDFLAIQREPFKKLYRGSR